MRAQKTLGEAVLARSLTLLLDFKPQPRS